MVRTTRSLSLAIGLTSNSWLALSEAPFTPMRADEMRSLRLLGVAGADSVLDAPRASEDLIEDEGERRRDLTILIRRTCPSASSVLHCADSRG